MANLILNRRTVLLGALTLPVLTTAARGQIAAQAPFTLGVASGDPSPDGFVIWTRIAPDPLAADGLGGVTAPVTVKWCVYSDEACKNAVQQGEIATTPAG